MTQLEIIQMIAGLIGSFGFAILYNIRGHKLLFASLGGFLSCALFIVFSKFIPSEPICYLIVAILISVYSEIFARVLKTPTTTFIIISLIPLIPGSSLYYTMSSAFSGNTEMFLNKAITTLELASALAIGIILVTAISQFINKIRSNRDVKSQDVKH